MKATPFSKTQVASALLAVCGGLSLSLSVNAAPQATYDAAKGILHIHGINVPASASKPALYSADLKLVSTNPDIQLELTTIGSAKISGEVAHYDPDFNKAFIPSVGLGADSFFAELELIPGSNPLRFRVAKLHSNKFAGCPSFATAASGNGCVLQGTISQDITLTNNITWILKGGVYIGGDKTKSATVHIEPNTRIAGQSGADFLYIRRGSKIDAIGTAQHPIIFTGAADGSDPNIGPGAWGGLVLAGNAPVNGCNASVAVCEQFDEALTTPYGGNNANDNSGILKYAQIRYAGIQVRPDQELNALTLLGVGAGTTLDFVQLYRGSDDGIEMFGGTVNFKHVVSFGNSDDSVDWGGGWNGRAQYVLIKQIADDGDNGIEADNNEVDNNSSPRAKPLLANFTAIGSGSSVGGNGALLRRGTGANIYNSIFTGFAKTCLNIDSTATFTNAGTPASLSGQLTINSSQVNCTKNFDDVASEPFLVSAWFNAQSGNAAKNPGLSGYLPGSGSILATGAAIPQDAYVEKTNYVGAFANSNDNWTLGWTVGLN
jgi:hypothetical protein